MRKLTAFICFILLSACSDEKPNAYNVVESFRNSGLNIEKVEERDANVSTDLPKVYDVNLRYRLKEKEDVLNSKGAQILTCSSKEQCNELMEYFKKMEGLGGKNYFQSKTGLIVVQMGDDVSPHAVEKIKSVLHSY